MKEKIYKIMGVGFLATFAIANLYPFVFMILYSFKSNDEIMFTNTFGLPEVWRYQNYMNAWSNFNIPSYFKSSSIVSSVAVVISLAFALMFAYATARMKWKGNAWARMYITAGMFIPIQIVLIPLVVLARDLNFANTYWALIFPYIAFNLSFPCLILYGFMRKIPFELEEAAYIDGAGIFYTFARIICPLLKPAIAAVMLFTFISVWNEFTLALIMVSDESLKTLPVGLVTFRGQFSTDWGGMGATMVLASIPTVIIYLILGEKLESAMAISSGIKG